MIPPLRVHVSPLELPVIARSTKARPSMSPPPVDIRAIAGRNVRFESLSGMTVGIRESVSDRRRTAAAGLPPS